MIDQKKASELARAGFDLWQAGRLEESVAKYKEALECADPAHYAVGDYHGECAAVLATLGRHEEARRQYEIEIAIAQRRGDGSSESMSRYFLSDLVLKMNEPLEALKIAEVVPNDGPGQWVLRIAQARALSALGRTAESREAVIAALAAAPNEKQQKSIREQFAHILDD